MNLPILTPVLSAHWLALCHGALLSIAYKCALPPIFSVLWPFLGWRGLFILRSQSLQRISAFPSSLQLAIPSILSSCSLGQQLIDASLCKGPTNHLTGDRLPPESLDLVHRGRGGRPPWPHRAAGAGGTGWPKITGYMPRARRTIRSGVHTPAVVMVAGDGLSGMAELGG